MPDEYHDETKAEVLAADLAFALNRAQNRARAMAEAVAEFQEEDRFWDRERVKFNKARAIALNKSVDEAQGVVVALKVALIRARALDRTSASARSVAKAVAKAHAQAVGEAREWTTARDHDHASYWARAMTSALARTMALARAADLAETTASKILARNESTPKVTIQHLERDWNRFGIILPAHAREKYFRPSLNDQAADCHEELTNTLTRTGRVRVIAWYTTLALLAALDSLRIALQRRLADELAWVVGKLSKS